MAIQWKTKAFEALTLRELYDVMRLRQEVFVVEQTCWYLDADGKDTEALHVMGYRGSALVAYTRLLDRGVGYDKYASIGRVVTAPAVRGTGLGRELMRRSLGALFEYFGSCPVKISAQAHLQDFYGSLGFEGEGEVYDEDGIPHRAMVYRGGTER